MDHIPHTDRIVKLKENLRGKGMKSVIAVLVVCLLCSCGGGGGGGTKCSDEKPLECNESDTCCPRGYPYACGDGYCYTSGCPRNAPSFEICTLIGKYEKVAPTLQSGVNMGEQSEGNSSSDRVKAGVMWAD